MKPQYNPRNRNQRLGPAHSWSHAFDDLVKAKRDTPAPCGFQVPER